MYWKLFFVYKQLLSWISSLSICAMWDFFSHVHENERRLMEQKRYAGHKIKILMFLKRKLLMFLVVLCYDRCLVETIEYISLTFNFTRYFLLVLENIEL